MSFSIMTDCSCDLLDGTVQASPEGVIVIPCYEIQADDKMLPYLPPLRENLELIEETMEKGDVLFLSCGIPRSFAGVRVAERCLNSLDKNHRFIKFNTKTLSFGLGYFISAALKMRQKGRDIQDTVDLLNTKRVKAFGIAHPKAFKDEFNELAYMGWTLCRRRPVFELSRECKITFTGKPASIISPDIASGTARPFVIGYGRGGENGAERLSKKFSKVPKMRFGGYSQEFFGEKSVVIFEVDMGMPILE